MSTHTKTTEIPRHLLSRLSSSADARGRLERALARRQMTAEVSDDDVIESIDDTDPVDVFGGTTSPVDASSYRWTIIAARQTVTPRIRCERLSGWDYRAAA